MEIGSVLELDDWSNYKNAGKREFYLPFMNGNKYNTVFYQSGRNAIQTLTTYLAEKFNFREILLPDYVCSTVKDAIERAGIKCKLYSINREFDYDIKQIEEKIRGGVKCIYIVQYFGKKISDDMKQAIKEWKSKDIIVIEDITMSLFSNDKNSIGFGDYIIGSIRKWLPIPDGGFISSQKTEIPKEPNDDCVSKYTHYYSIVQIMKKEYIKNNLSDKELKDNYMEYYKKSIDELFSDYKIYSISQVSKSYINNYNMEEIIEKREYNYDYLYNKINEISNVKPKIKRENNMLPFGMLIETQYRDELLKYLIEAGIYCNVHWRLPDNPQNRDVQYLSNSIITIPCDQRYGESEMDYIANVLKKWRV